MDRPRAKLEQLFLWRQAANWSPVLWLPLVVFWLLTGRTPTALGLGIAGLAFIAVARLVVWSARCPGCAAAIRSTPGGFRRIWSELACAACGLSLFELRRGDADAE